MTSTEVGKPSKLGRFTTLCSPERGMHLLGYISPQEHHVHPGADDRVTWNLAYAARELEAGGWQIREQQEEFYDDPTGSGKYGTTRKIRL